MKKLICILFIITPLYLFSQYNYKFTEWDSAILKKANTCAQSSYMTKTEKEIVWLCNLARTDGNLFIETFLAQYLKTNSADDSYLESLVADLKPVKNLPLFKPDKELFLVAKGHATKSGKTGHVGHKDFNTRMEPLLKRFSAVAENCDYGNSSALEIVLSLLIDEDVPSLGHRKNILNIAYTFVGVSIQNHSIYGVNCVMDFAGE